MHINVITVRQSRIFETAWKTNVWHRKEKGSRFLATIILTSHSERSRLFLFILEKFRNRIGWNKLATSYNTIKQTMDQRIRELLDEFALMMHPAGEITVD